MREKRKQEKRKGSYRTMGGRPGAVLDPNTPQTLWPLEGGWGGGWDQQSPLSLHHRGIQAIFTPTHPVQPPHISRGRQVLCQLSGFSGVGAIVASFVSTECPVGRGMWGIWKALE